MTTPISNEGSNPIGHAWLRRELNLAVPPPAVESYVVAGARRTEVRGRRIVEQYPRQYATEESIVAHLRFALRHEPIDLGVLVATFKAIEATDLEAWVRAEPTGAFSRRAWFFYETFTGRMLDLDDARTGNYVPALDPAKHIVGEPRRSRRHRVADNLLGGAGLCPTVRRTPRLTEQMDLRIDRQAWALIESIDAGILARAVHYLFTKETRSSFALEGEIPSTARSERFVAALREGGDFDPSDKAALIRLQGDIVDPRYAATGWRTFQNFVGATVGGYREDVHFVCPRPEDVPGLMEAWMSLTRPPTSIGTSTRPHSRSTCTTALPIRFAVISRKSLHSSPCSTGRVPRYGRSWTCRTVGWRCSCGSACKTADGCPRRNGAFSQSWTTSKSPRCRHRSGTRSPPLLQAHQFDRGIATTSRSRGRCLRPGR